MAQDPNAQGPGPADQGPGAPPGDQQSSPLTQMIISTDKALQGIASVLAKASPDAAKAISDLDAQFRQIITSVMNGNQDQGQSGGQRAASPMASPETHGKPAVPAY